MKIKDSLTLALGCLLIFSACAGQKSLFPAPSGQNTKAAQQKTITICINEEPESLYLYSANSNAAKIILQAIYDGPIDYKEGEAYPVILEKIPNLKDGSAFAAPIDVNAGDMVVDIQGEIVALQPGTKVFPSGCASRNCAVTWDGLTPLRMDFLTAAYHLKSDLKWSDGQPLTASDSVFSFTIASNPETPGSKYAYERTATYSVVDDLTLQWTSKPGLITDEFEKYFWSPLPEHAWGSYSVSDLLTSDAVNRSPLGWGAYKVESWTEGQSIRLVRNPYYFRASEGLPFFDSLVFKFVGPFADAALSNLKYDRSAYQQFNYDLGDFEEEIKKNGCDLVSNTYEMRDQLPVLNILINYFQDPAIKVIKSTEEDETLLFLNLREKPIAIDNPLLNPGIRKAVDLCLNRDKAIQELSFGYYELPHSLLFSRAGDSPEFKSAKRYDPIAAAELLEKIGWSDEDKNALTPRLAAGISGIEEGRQLQFTYLVEDSLDNSAASEIFKASLGECGIGIDIKFVPAEIFWNAAHADSIFQENYDFVQLTWPAPINDPCLLFSSQSIPSKENDYLGFNFSGFQNTGFDQACEQLETTHLKGDRTALLTTMESILKEEMPVLPLYSYLNLLIAQTNFCTKSLEMNKIQSLDAIEEFKISPECK